MHFSQWSTQAQEFKNHSTSHSGIDLVLELPKVTYVIEIKFNKTAQNALNQITERRYYEKFMLANRSITLLGLLFNRAPHNFAIEYDMIELDSV
jgi:hypothetical protein